MDKVRYVMMVLSATATVLCFVANVTTAGAQGWILVAACVIPLAIGLTGTRSGQGLSRRQALGSVAALLIASMKSSGGLDSIMMAAFFGMLAALILAIKPERTS